MKAVTYQGIKKVQVKNVDDPKIKEKDDIIYGTGKDRIQAFWLDVDG